MLMKKSGGRSANQNYDRLVLVVIMRKEETLHCCATEKIVKSKNCNNFIFNIFVIVINIFINNKCRTEMLLITHTIVFL